MEKRGQVTEIHGEKALVKTLSINIVGSGCCGGFSSRDFENVEVENLCGARVGDWIVFETEDDKEKDRAKVVALVTFIAFLLGECVVQVVLKALGWTAPQKVIPFAVGVGLATGTAALLSCLGFYRKHPLKPSVATQVVPAPKENFDEKVYLI